MSFVDQVREAHEALKAAVKPSRREAHAKEGRLASTFRVAMKAWDEMKAEGATLQARVDGLEAMLRDVWPFTREWKYLCANCEDGGLVFQQCPGDASCGRHKAHLAHSYGTPCWCSLGNRFKSKPRGADDFTAAGRTTKPTRPGR